MICIKFYREEWRLFPAELIQVSAFHSFTLAIVLLFLGRKTADRWDILRRYSIPEPVVWAG